MKNISARKIYFFIGTTAEFIKLAPIIKELQRRKIGFKIITSGQTRVRFGDFKGYCKELKVDIALPEKTNRSSPVLFLWWAIRAFFIGLYRLRKEFKGLNKSNSYFIIFGDPVSTTLGAIIAWIYGLTIVHLESGDMSSNLLEPFPEEISRNINIRLADILFPPTKWAETNLTHINKIKVNTHYNTLLEGFWWMMIKKSANTKLKQIKNYYILILHRQEHVIFRKGWSRKILKYVIENAPSDLNCVLFNHPLTVEIIKSLNLSSKIEKKLKIMPLIPYQDFLKLMKNSKFIATDGATNQLEAYLMGKPCLVLRDYTEQIEGINKNVVLCKSDELIINQFLKNYKKYITKPVKSSIRPSKIVVDYLIQQG
jgi:UDP-N-acetylglucosamine 2-epimerase (non-hydrolysing)